MKQYNIWLFTPLLLLLIATAVFNGLVDPYRLFNSPQIKNINANKPLDVKHTRLAKAQLIKQHPSETLILGSSTGEIGLRPDHPLLLQPAYNLSFSAANSYEMLRYLQHATAYHPPKRVIVVVNLFMLNAHRGVRPDFEESLLSVDTFAHKNRLALKPYATGLLSWNTLKDSIRTLNHQNDTPFLLDNGQRNPVFCEQTNHKQSVEENFSQAERHWPDNLTYDEPEPDFFTCQHSTHSSLDDMAQLIKHCQQHNIQLTVMIAPVHARMLSVYAQSGHLDHLFAMKQQLAQLLSQSPDSTLWDFATLNVYTTEEIQTQQTDQSLTWFSDDVHFSPKLGDLMLERAFGKRSDTFGRLLTRNTVAAHNRQLRRSLKQWQHKHVAAVAEIAANIRR